MNKERHVCARRRVGEAAGPEGRARRPKARRSSEPAIAAEMLMNNAGKAAKKSIRIVYRIVDQEILVEVVAIGKREDLAVYQEALKRLTQRKR